LTSWDRLKRNKFNETLEESEKILYIFYM